MKLLVRLLQRMWVNETVGRVFDASRAQAVEGDVILVRAESTSLESSQARF